MIEYKNILVGLNVFFPDWIPVIKNINKPNFFIKDFCEIENNTSNIDYILPLSREDYEIISKKNINVKILYPSINIMHLLHDKIIFTKFMLKYHQNNIPKVYYLEEKLYDSNINYPVISKPKISVSGSGMTIINNKTELSKIKNKIIIQKYISNDYEYGAFMLCIDGEIINYKIIREIFSKKSYIKKKNYKNYEEVKDFDITLFRKIIKQLNYSGGCNIDFKFVNNIIYIFEINPRFGGSAFTCNFFYELICIKK